jgi:hypothetical protein
VRGEYVEQLDWYSAQQEARARAGLPPGRGAASWFGVTPSSPEQRRAYLEQVLVEHIYTADQSDPETERDGSFLDECANAPKDDPEYGDINSPSVRSDPDQAEDDKKVDDDTKACAICLEEYVDGDAVCRSYNSRCKHFFHRKCIIDWLLSDETCPCCRQKYLEFSDSSTVVPSSSAIDDDDQEQVTRQVDEALASADAAATGQADAAVAPTATADATAGRSSAIRLPARVATLRRKIRLSTLFRGSSRLASVGAVELVERGPISTSTEGQPTASSS